MANLQENTLEGFFEYWEQLILAGALESPSSAAPTGELTCAWIMARGICGSILSQDPTVACLHFRGEHGIRGGDKEVTICLWNGCRLDVSSLCEYVLAQGHQSSVFWSMTIITAWIQGSLKVQ
ncbi:hypothetical protein BS17DRAFT_763565 [Gyrodon lividus]|nr:hypothetical protein BS17DRAFT_763565 [Gyrodon lividus]